MPYRFAVLTLVGITFIWGTTFVVVKDVVASVPVALFLALRFSVAALSLAWVRPTRAVLLPSLILGLLTFAGFTSQTIGLVFTTASKAAFITGLSVILTPIVSALWFKKALPLRVFVAALIALVGLALMTLTGGVAGINVGDLWVLGTALAYALYVVYLGEVAKEHSALVIGAWQLWPTALLAWLWALPQLGELATLSASSFLAIAYLGVVATALIAVLQSRAQQFVPAHVAALIFVLEPVFAAIFAFLWHQEVLGWWGLLGGALVLSAMLISEVKPRGLRQ